MSDFANGILFVDDEKLALRYFARGLGSHFKVFKASSAMQALETLEANHEDIALLISDQRMPEATGVDFLVQARERYPDKIRILTSAYSDEQATIDAVNKAGVYYFVRKPWNLKELQHTLRRALEYYTVERHENLLKDKLKKLNEMIKADRALALGLMAADLGHYVNNALVPAVTFIEHLQHLEHSDEGELWESFREDALNSLRRLSESLKHLHVVSEAPSADSYRPVDLGRAAESVAFEAQARLARHGLQLDIIKSNEEIVVNANESRISKLFSFLLNEAFEILPDGGTVKLDIKAQGEPLDPSGAVIDISFVVPDKAQVTKQYPSELLYPFRSNQASPSTMDFNIIAAYLITRFHNGQFEIEQDAQSAINFTIQLPSKPKKPIDYLPDGLSLAKALETLRPHNNY